MIRAMFDLRKCPVTAETLAQSERGYLASRDLEYFFATTARSIDDRVAVLRELPGRFATVSKLAEDTPGLTLDLAPAEELVTAEPALT